MATLITELTGCPPAYPPRWGGSRSCGWSIWSGETWWSLLSTWRAPVQPQTLLRSYTAATENFISNSKPDIVFVNVYCLQRQKIPSETQFFVVVTVYCCCFFCVWGVKYTLVLPLPEYVDVCSQDMDSFLVDMTQLAVRYQHLFKTHRSPRETQLFGNQLIGHLIKR